jgi:hypothetical protein
MPLVAIILWLSTAAAWVTHVVATITAGAWGLLLIGALIAPIGVIHGVMIWLGMPWAR